MSTLREFAKTKWPEISENTKIHLTYNRGVLIPITKIGGIVDYEMIDSHQWRDANGQPLMGYGPISDILVVNMDAFDLRGEEGHSPLETIRDL